jgi:hypothetical protein
VPSASGSEPGGAASFFAYCSGADGRARQRRLAIESAFAAYRRARTRGEDPYPPALMLCQRLGVALEDLARITLALQALGESDAFEVLRMAPYDVLDDAYARPGDEPEALRQAFRLPTVADSEDVAPELREAVLAASDALGRRWVAQFERCTSAWQLLRRLSKALRHGSPLLPRELVIGPPGAGALGEGLADQFERWVLLVGTEADHEARALNTTYAVADLGDRTLARARQGGLEGVALARDLAGAHAIRVRTQTRWALPREVYKLVEPQHRRVLRRHARV